MNYAKYISQTEIIFPSSEDYLEDGVTFKNPLEWMGYEETDKPADGNAFKDYTASYQIQSSDVQNTFKIVKTWTVFYKEPIGRMAKLVNGSLVLPNRNEYNANGNLINNYNSLPNSRKMIDGWYLVEETDYPTDGKVYHESGVLLDHADYGNVIKVVWEEVISAPEPPFNISKKLLLDKIVAMNQFSVFNSILDSDPVLHEYWLISVTLKSDDPLVVAMIPAFSQAFSLSESQIMDMLRGCESDL